MFVFCSQGPAVAGLRAAALRTFQGQCHKSVPRGLPELSVHLSVASVGRVRAPSEGITFPGAPHPHPVGMARGAGRIDTPRDGRTGPQYALHSSGQGAQALRGQSRATAG